MIIIIIIIIIIVIIIIIIRVIKIVIIIIIIISIIIIIIKSYDPLIHGVRFRYMTLSCMVWDSDKWPSDSRSVQKSKFTTFSSQ